MLFKGVGQSFFVVNTEGYVDVIFEVLPELTGQRVCWPDLINNELYVTTIA